MFGAKYQPLPKLESPQSLSSSSAPKRYHWQQVITRNPKAYVIRPAKPDAAKEDLQRFIVRNQLRYKHRREDEADFAIREFENFFQQLQLNEDDELLDRADRRDLPIRIQKLRYKSNASKPPIVPKGEREPEQQVSEFRKRSRRSSSAGRRSAIPNTIFDDYAYRRYNQGSGARLLHATETLDRRKDSPSAGPKPACSYLSLVSYCENHHLETRSRSASSTCAYCGDSYSHQCDEQCPASQMPNARRYPDLIDDDVLNRRIRQSPGANVSAPQPPFGVPNSPLAEFVHTFPQSDYSRVEPDIVHFRNRSYRRKEREPHLVNDDMAFRNLRKDYRHCRKIENDDDEDGGDGVFWRVQRLPRTTSSPDLSIRYMRRTLRTPVHPTQSLNSSISDSCTPSSTSLESSSSFLPPPPPPPPPHFPPPLLPATLDTYL